MRQTDALASQEDHGGGPCLGREARMNLGYDCPPAVTLPYGGVDFRGYAGLGSPRANHALPGSTCIAQANE
jgi:hypothetical protein